MPMTLSKNMEKLSSIIETIESIYSQPSMTASTHYLPVISTSIINSVASTLELYPFMGQSLL
jgi:hypothetical protein